MTFREDQHVDDWAEVAVDYLDGRLDQQTRMAVERHLSGCPDCAARLRRQQAIVNFVQRTPLHDPPQDLEDRALGELLFPSARGRQLETARRRPAARPSWQRTLRAWLPATVAVVALLAAVVGYGLARSASDLSSKSEQAADSRVASTAAAGSSAPETELPEATLAGALTTAAAAGATSTTAGATTSTALGAEPSTTAAPVTVTATQDRKAMIRELENAQAPTYVSFRAPADKGATATDETSATTTTVGPETTTSVTISATQVDDAASQITRFTGLEPVDESLWLGGPTFAAFLPREDAEELVDLVRAIGASLGLVVTLEGGPPAESKQSATRLLEQKSRFPILEAHRAPQPATWGYEFTTSTLVPPSEPAQPGTTAVPPDDAGTHVLLLLWIQK
jgi:anti-sigma factor RsiW